MNISYSWLKDYIDFDLNAEELGAALTSTGLECGGVETVESIRGGLRGLVVGKVLTCVEHPDSDHLHITTVDLGEGHVEQIVCGAPNVAAGQTVIVATVGTTLYDGDKEFKIKKSKIRGVESMGMICAEDEIGVGTSHDGIIVITDDVKPGTPAAEYFNVSDDYVLEVDLTPNRIDAASHYGVARDLAAWMSVHAEGNGNLRRPSVDAFAVERPEGAVSVQVDDTEGVTRYCGVTIEGVKVAESPDWLKNRLTAIGLHPINNIVDITNYILHAIGQPLHCFDRSKIKGDRIVVRTCAKDTPFVTLDGVERKLDERDLMICNESEPMCIAGVFGGLDSGTTEAATSVFIESACFNPTRVRKTARRHGLNTDSSFRFERGVDPNGCMYALKLAALMIKELAGGTITGPVVDIYPAEVKPSEVDLAADYMDRLIGRHIPDADVDTILAALEMKVTANANGVRHILVPTYRVDVTRPCDVVEDVLRIYGYNNIPLPLDLHASLSFKTPVDAADDMRRLVSGQLTACGFNEILNNSLTARAYYEGLTGLAPEKCVALLNPLSQDLNVMRQTLLFGGLESIAHNVNRKSKDLAFYEYGNVYTRTPGVEITAENPLAPFSEHSRFALWMTGNARRGNWIAPAEEATFFHLKAYVANIFSRLGISEREIAVEPAENELLDSALAISTRSGKPLGVMGVVARGIAKRCDVKVPVFFAELCWDALMSLALKKKVTYADLPKTQPVKRDLALLLDDSIPMARVERIVRDSEKKLLRSVELFDVYEGDKLPAGKKSYAITMTIQDNEKTLNDKAIDAVMNKIIANLRKQLGAELR